jgi:hypothetical protein
VKSYEKPGYFVTIRSRGKEENTKMPALICFKISEILKVYVTEGSIAEIK